VVSGVDLPHAAAADRGEDLVLTDPGARRELIEERRILLAPEAEESVEETASSRKGVVVRSIKRFFGLK
jgi:hypothetical protein